MKHIPLTKGKAAEVDDEDFEAINVYKWYYLASGTGYAVRRTKTNGIVKTILMHRQILNPGADLEVDHIDGNGLNNCKINLRPATHAQNMRNRIMKGKGTSQYKGVYFNKSRGMFCAEIKFEGIKKHLGYFSNQHEAGQAYNAAAKSLFGEFEKTNSYEKTADAGTPAA